MASCVYIINMIKCFPRMKLQECHTTPGYYQRGFAVLTPALAGSAMLRSLRCAKKLPLLLQSEQQRFADVHG